MDDYIKGLRHEVDELALEVIEYKTSARKELDVIDRQIFKLVRMKEQLKAKSDAMLQALKDQHEEKREMYNKVAGSSVANTNHPRMDRFFSEPTQSSPGNQSHVSDANHDEGDEDAAYYPSKAAEKRAAVYSRNQSHHQDHEDDIKPRIGNSNEALSSYNANSGMAHIVDIQDYAIIVPHPKEKATWIQVYCPICKGNMRGDGRWFKGVMGAKRHMRLAHKEVCSITSNKVLFGENEVERLIERRFTFAEIEGMKKGLVPLPLPAAGSSETVDESFQEKGGLEAYTAFDKYPTIVRRADGKWVELLCPRCKGNCVEEEFLNGVTAFRQHLQHDHAESFPKGAIPAAWVVEQCETRVFTEHELMALLEDRDDAAPPEKFNIGPALVEDAEDEEEDDDDEDEDEDEKEEEETAPAERSRTNLRPHKRFSGLIEEGDLDEQKLREVKRRRQSSTTSSPSVLTRKDAPIAQRSDTPTVGERYSEMTLSTQDTRSGHAVSEWGQCCPCTLEGHSCQYRDCTKTEVCMELDHSKDCRPGATHVFTPVCMMFLLGQQCDPKSCAFSHDAALKKAVERHECEKH